MNGASNQFLACTGLSQDENRRIRRRHRLYLFQDFFQGRTFTDNLFEVVFGADLVLEVELLFAKLVRTVHDLTIRERVLDSDGYLIGHMLQQIGILLRECLRL